MKEVHTPKGCDFFDIDHTIVDGSTSLQSLVTGIELQILPLSIMYSIPKLYMQYSFGSLDIRIAAQCIQDLKGLPKADVLKIGEQNYVKRIRPRIFKEAEECIAQRASSGRMIVLITSSFTHVIQPLALHLHTEHVFANALLYDNDRTSGYLKEPFLFGEEKKIQALKFMETHEISPLDCSFFTDSYNDLSLLEIVGEPVAVNPDRRLRKIARARNWKIEKFSEYAHS
jgi:putative phosphoserine phosphatase / 1-acylglycerol-3-phosphate O-acyltransferase